MLFSPKIAKLYSICVLREKVKVQQTRLFTGLFGGELGIRTLGPFRDTAFRVLHLRPLGQLSTFS